MYGKSNLFIVLEPSSVIVFGLAMGFPPGGVMVRVYLPAHKPANPYSPLLSVLVCAVEETLWMFTTTFAVACPVAEFVTLPCKRAWHAPAGAGNDGWPELVLGVFSTCGAGGSA